MRLLLVPLLLSSTLAQAGVVGVLRHGDVSIDLFDESRMCVEGARYMEFRQGANPPIPGCWKVMGSVLFGAFFDGDSLKAPVSAIEKPGQS